MSNGAPLLLDVTRLIWRRWKGRYPTGIDRVCLAYLSHFRGRAQAVVQHARFRRILDWNSSQALFDLLEDNAGSFRFRLVWSALRRGVGKSHPGENRLYLNIGHTGLNSYGFRDWVRRADVRPVYFVHDLIPITHPQFCRGGEADRHRERMITVLTTAAGVVGNSQATLDELAEFASAEGLPRPPSVAAWLGVDPLPAPADFPPLPRPTFVLLSTIEARKNHRMLLDVWSTLVEGFGTDAPQLLIIGQRGWEADDVFTLLDAPHRFQGRVTELNRCSDAELARHLRSARALLFPSLAEGYGLPLVEAFTAGLPAIVSDIPVFHEIGGDIPLFLDPADRGAWQRAIVDYSDSGSASRREQLAKIRSFRPPSWAGHFKRVECWLANLSSAAEPLQH